MRARGLYDAFLTGSRCLSQPAHPFLRPCSTAPLNLHIHAVSLSQYEAHQNPCPPPPTMRRPSYRLALQLLQPPAPPLATRG